MGKTRRTLGPDPVCCANCSSDCSPQNFKRLADILPKPDLHIRTTRRAKKPEPRTRLKNVGVPMSGSDSEDELPSISSALSVLFAIPLSDLNSGKPIRFLCRNCILVLAKTWTAYNEFKQLCIKAPVTAFLYPYMIPIKEEVPDGQTEPVEFEPIQLKDTDTSDSEDRDPLALSEVEVDDEHDLGQTDYSNSRIESTVMSVIDPNRVIRIELEPLNIDKYKATHPADNPKSKLGNNANHNNNSTRSLKRGGSLKTRSNIGKTAKHLEKEERANRLAKLSKLKEKFVRGRDVDAKNRAMKKQSREKDRKKVKKVPAKIEGRNVVKGKKSICPLCQRCFTNPYILKNHMNVTHQRKKKCRLCNEVFSFHRDYSKHVTEAHTGKDALPCSICGDGTYTTPARLLRHMIMKHNTEKTFDCENCKLKFLRETMLERHRNKGPCHPKAIVKAAPVEWKKPPESWRILLPRTPEGRWICETCNTDFGSYVSLWKHRRSAHEDLIKPTRISIPRTPEGLYTCVICNKNFISRGSIWTHRRFAHEREKIKPPPSELGFPCTICGTHYKNYAALWKHKRERHSENPLSCGYPDCGKIFATPSKLTAHQATHVGRPVKDVVCSEPGCKSRFKNEVGLADHVKRIHLNRNKFPCPLCTSSFAKAKLLRHHNITHLPPTNICEQCGKLFKHKKHLTRHQRTVHIEESAMKYPCSYCPRGFQRKDILQVHLTVAKHVMEDSRNVDNVMKELHVDDSGEGDLNIGMNANKQGNYSTTSSNSERDNNGGDDEAANTLTIDDLEKIAHISSDVDGNILLVHVSSNPVSSSEL